MPEIISVLPPIPTETPYSYLLPKGMTVAPGQILQVPVKRRSCLGIVESISFCKEAPANLKMVEKVLSETALSATMITFLNWMAAYTLTPRGMILDMMLPNAKVLSPPKLDFGYSLGFFSPRSAGKAQERILAYLQAQTVPIAATVLRKEARVTTAVLDKLVEQGALRKAPLEQLAHNNCPAPQEPILNSQQAHAAQSLDAAMEAAKHQTFLLDGVTGSGKTEVYFHAIAHALQQGKQVLVMLPEIALSAQWQHRFQQRFGFAASTWHSNTPITQKQRVWRGIQHGTQRVVVGARSALFLPFQKLGLIVVDEEHDSSYKQEERVFYNARDMAVARAYLEDLPIILASATPSLESLHNCQQGRYKHLPLTTRYGQAQLPEVQLIDIRGATNSKDNKWLSGALIEKLSQTLEQKQQALLFLNRRGHAPLMLCHDCGFRFACLQCQAFLVYHQQRKLLICHHCGYVAKVPPQCPQCKGQGSFTPYGPGVEQVAEEVQRLFPAARIRLATTDSIRNVEDMQNLVTTINEYHIDILIGTQMLAKGHHFPRLTLVGIIDGDMGLSGAELRAAEQSYHLLHQVAGRAGRAQDPGTVLIQTTQPDHPVMQALQSYDRDSFYQAEATGRAQFHLPPYGYLAGLIISGREEMLVKSAAQQLRRTAPDCEDIEILGPTPALLSRLRGRYRWRLLAKTSQPRLIQHYMRQWLGTIKLPSSIRLQVDIDPYSFY